MVVPLLLSAGYHDYVNVARAAVADEKHSATPGLAPDPALARRVHEACDRSGAPLGQRDAVVVATAGSSDQRAVADRAVVAEQVDQESAGRWPSPTLPRCGRGCQRRSPPTGPSLPKVDG